MQPVPPAGGDAGRGDGHDTDRNPVDDGPTPRWGMLDIIGSFLVGQIAVVVGFGILASSKGVPVTDLDVDSLSIGETALLQVPLWLGLGVGPLVLTSVRGNGPIRDLGLRIRASDFPLGVVVGVACQFVLVPLVTLPFILLTDAEYEDVSEPARELSDRASGLGVIVLVLVVVVGAPVVEEIFYRGMVQRTLRRRLGPIPAAVVTATVFGASHLQLLQFPALVAFGLVLSYYAERDGRLGFPIAVHAGFNATTVAVLLLGG